jgi:hypothetical protein
MYNQFMKATRIFQSINKVNQGGIYICILFIVIHELSSVTSKGLRLKVPVQYTFRYPNSALP